jgi:hypothetical protein
MSSIIVQPGFLGNNNAVVYGGPTTPPGSAKPLPEPLVKPFNFVLLGGNPVTPPNSSPNPGGVPVAIPNDLPSKAGLPVIIPDSAPIPGIL